MRIECFAGVGGRIAAAKRLLCMPGDQCLRLLLSKRYSDGHRALYPANGQSEVSSGKVHDLAAGKRLTGRRRATMWSADFGRGRGGGHYLR